MPPRVWLTLPTFGAWAGDDWGRVLDLAREAEAAGVDGVVVPDHVVIGPRTDAYPAGPFPLPVDAPWLEPLQALTAVAAVTERLRLATGILVAPVRPAVVLAKAVATLDVVSRGRVELGVGTGWQREELEAAGVPWAERGLRLTDAVAVCRALWESDGPVTLTLPTVQLDRILSRPVPVQPRLPVLFSGTLHERNLRRIVELGDGWIPFMGEGTEAVRAGAALLHRAYEDAGRDPAALVVRAPVATDLADVAALVSGGVTDLVTNLRHVTGDLADLVTRLRNAAEG